MKCKIKVLPSLFDHYHRTSVTLVNFELQPTSVSGNARGCKKATLHQEMWLNGTEAFKYGRGDVKSNLRPNEI